jgi:hypothetical protein
MRFLVSGCCCFAKCCLCFFNRFPLPHSSWYYNTTAAKITFVIHATNIAQLVLIMAKSASHQLGGTSKVH